MKITIRRETKTDIDEIYNLIKTAFETANVKDGTEQDFASNLRSGECYIPELALVATYGDKLIGHIMFTKTYVTQPNGNREEVLLVAPLSVLLEYRNNGVGKALMEEGFRLAREMGYRAAFLCGDPGYYNRFGFRAISEYEIVHKSIPAPFVMACELVPNGLKGITGLVRVE